MLMHAPNIMLAAGGTGGHMMPAEAVADVLVQDGYRVSLITDIRGDNIKNALVDTDRFVLKTSSHATGGIVGRVKALISVARSTLQMRKLFKKDRPTVVVGFGGYPSLPAVLAARNLGIPFVLHEQNAVLGRVNRFLAEDARVLALSMPDTEKVPVGAYTELTGNPVRQLIAKLANIAYAVPIGFGDVRLLVLGGSQGARILSDVIPAAIAKLPEDLRQRIEMTQQARPEDVDRVVEAYEKSGVRAKVQPYFDDVGALLLRAQLVICRSGASTISELAAMGRPAIMVPLKIAADDHQSANAKIIEEAGGGWVMDEDSFTPDALAQKLEHLLTDMGDLRDASEGMRNVAQLDAATRLASIIVKVSEESEAAA